MANLGDLIKNAVNIEDLPEGNDVVEPVLERPSKEVDLASMLSDYLGVKRTKWGITEDLIVVDINLSDPVDKTEVPEYKGFEYLIQDKNTHLIYIAPTERVLNNNFIYREDLDIVRLESKDDYENIIGDMLSEYPRGKKCRTACYILESTVLESYTPYYNHEAVIQKFGVTTPKGYTIRRYVDRFERDRGILELEQKYSSTSFKEAGKLLKLNLSPNEAVIISDGSNVKNVISCSVCYIDNSSFINLTECTLPSNPSQAVLLSEIKGATNALNMCLAKGKTKVTYYYDNTSIVNCFNNKRLGGVSEVKAFKELVVSLMSKGYDINLLEIHPKTQQADEEVNNKLAEERKGLKYLHSFCDGMCTKVSQLYLDGYKDKILINNENALNAKALAYKASKKPNSSTYNKRK